MKPKTILILPIIALTFLVLAGCSKTGELANGSGDPDLATQTVFKNLMAATISKDYDAFMAECDEVMKATLTKPVLERVNVYLAPRAEHGYEAQYLGGLNQLGYKVTLWKLHFKDNGDDILATLSIKDGKAGGFLLH